jgi:hypothetical protein
MPPQPAFGDRAHKRDAVLIWCAASFEKRAVDQLDLDTAVLNRLDPVGERPRTPAARIPERVIFCCHSASMRY